MSSAPLPEEESQDAAERAASVYKAQEARWAKAQFSKTFQLSASNIAGQKTMQGIAASPAAIARVEKTLPLQHTCSAPLVADVGSNTMRIARNAGQQDKQQLSARTVLGVADQQHSSAAVLRQNKQRKKNRSQAKPELPAYGKNALKPSSYGRVRKAPTRLELKYDSEGLVPPPTGSFSNWT
ncbi:MAG: hypothetical protein FRX49_13173 [Trebouxia sp. A1-2]|nr:MAG: hypothetical protein FRX49_13173 [Trebouxia sp. A1-2]